MRAMRCPVCDRPSDAPFLTRRSVSVHQNLVVDTPEAARALRAGALALHVCAGCGFVFNGAFDPGLLQYSTAYDNTQTCSPTFQQHVETRADHIVRARGVRNATIVEVGCGNGSFLSALVQRDAGSHGIGFDPSYVGGDTAVDGRVRFERRFYDERAEGLDADTIVCRHVIEHVQRPLALLQTIRRTIRSAEAQIFFETPCVEWILRNEIVWDFFYEHCSYFTASSLAHAFARAGFEAVDVSRVFGGQYLWAEGRPAAVERLSSGDASRIVELAQRYAAREAAIVEGLRGRVRDLLRRGAVAIWGAAAKGVTLANLIDPDATRVACVVDINPNKQGKFLPGTAHPIVGPVDLATLDVRTALVTNPNYFEENSRIVRDAGLNVELVDLMHSNEAHADTD
jgi:SAM-dependent methyltransferase